MSILKHTIIYTFENGTTSHCGGIVPSAAVKSFRRTSSSAFIPPHPTTSPRSSSPTSSQYLRKQMEILNVNNNNYRSPAGCIMYIYIYIYIRIIIIMFLRGGLPIGTTRRNICSLIRFPGPI